MYIVAESLISFDRSAYAIIYWVYTICHEYEILDLSGCEEFAPNVSHEAIVTSTPEGLPPFSLHMWAITIPVEASILVR